ncbi:hypothetical protein Forpe1208_v016468 [Fusarium oxysporum f. sp. rapae]|uniref:HAT C-terminal dimerisation domain-containing protein n=1 Tax=Fusarium oxysporum f. sp. rapae TaxID=485398 RepID=A0A8J5TP51_FUSOX|nr:hypothetical protein Forpe1208_v016574 [Fusarium oxysporum f. sp. rapae]KAG7403234.1 hypothetical protein Forpe1208_v016468 [Fusarium oxysporum f. sp. rapae]
MDSFLSHTPSDRESSIAATIETASEIPDRQSLPSVEPSTSTTPKRKRITTADATWQPTRKPRGSESERAGPKQDLIHSVEAAGSEPNSTKKVRTSLIKEAFNKAGEIQVAKLQEREEQVLRNVLNPKAAMEALVQLVTVRNLPYNCNTWPELHALLMAANYTAEELINTSHGHVQKLCSNSYAIHKDILRKKLQSSPAKLHLSDESPAYAAALILHPSRGKAHIQKNWPKAWHKIFTGVKKLWEDEYKNLPTIYTTPSIVPALELDEYDLLAQELNVIGTEPDVDEYETYTSQPPIPIDCSPLVWCLRDEQKERFPRLSKMAIDILSMPAMSADPERTFSGARRTISWDRMLLGASTIEKGECLKSWILSGKTAGLQVDEVEQYECMAEEESTSALEEDVGP